MTNMWTTLAAAFLLAMTGSAAAGPVGGPKRSSDFKVPASQEKGVPGENDLIVECNGNEKTHVVVQGDHRPVTDLELLVFEISADQTQKLIARDTGTKDVVGVVFTPPRKGLYRIVVRNPSAFDRERNPFNQCYLSVK